MLTILKRKKKDIENQFSVPTVIANDRKYNGLEQPRCAILRPTGVSLGQNLCVSWAALSRRL